MTLQLLSATFSLPLEARDIPRWRGAWAELAGWEMDRFHNHLPGEEGVIPRYPQVQYRVRRRQAALLALQQGVKDVQQTLAKTDWTIRWRDELFALGMEDLRMETFELHVQRQPTTYRLRRYLPFNSENFRAWDRADTFAQRLDLLNRLLPGHLLAFATGVGWQVPERFTAEITDIYRQESAVLHDIRRPAFDLAFRTNLFLPPGIGLGKGVSHGFGLVSKPKAGPIHQRT